MNPDSVTDLMLAVRSFCEARDWDQFHAPKELAIGLVTEASELLAQFRFLSTEQVAARLSEPIDRREVEHEVADVLFFTLRFCERCGITPGEALKSKLAVLEGRYPVDRARGNNLKYDRL
jgi:hypothetical protein